MQIYFHSRLWSYLPRVPILVEDTVYSEADRFEQDFFLWSFLDSVVLVLDTLTKSRIKVMFLSCQ